MQLQTFAITHLSTFFCVTICLNHRWASCNKSSEMLCQQGFYNLFLKVKAIKSIHSCFFCCLLRLYFCVVIEKNKLRPAVIQIRNQSSKDPDLPAT